MIFSVVRLLLQSKSQAKVVLVCISEVESLSNLSLGRFIEATQSFEFKWEQ